LTRRLVRVGGIILLALLGSGCATAVRRPASPPSVRLVSKRMLVLQPADTTQPSCTVRQAEVQVLAVRGDTIHFASATPLTYPTGAPRCQAMQPGWIALSEHPDLQIERLTAPTPTALAVFWGTIAALGLGLVLLVVTSLGQT
jgi:hypothetical protein